MRKKHREQATLIYPKHRLKPEEVLDFIEMEGFAEDWEHLGLNDTDLAALQVCIMSMPTGSPIIAGTGGLRKARFAPKHWGTGKRGAARICYVYFKEYSMALLVKAYSKKDQGNLSGAQRVAIRAVLQVIKRELALGPIS